MTADILLLTPQCWRELRDDPAWYHERLMDLHREYPELGVLVLTPAGGTPAAMDMAELLKRLAASPEEPEAGIEPSGPNL